MIKSVDAFADSGHSDDEAMRYATFCFFAGLLITAMLNGFVHYVVRRNRLDTDPETFQNGGDAEKTGARGKTSEDVETGKLDGVRIGIFVQA